MILFEDGYPAGITAVCQRIYIPPKKIIKKPRKPKKKYGPVYKKYKYSVMDGGVIIYSGTATYIANILERTIEYINFAARKRLTVKGKYIIERVEIEATTKSD